MTEIHQVREKVKKFANEVREGSRVGITGKPIKTILNIGIGGSLLGLKSTYEGMQACEDVRLAKQPILNMRFIANVDPADFGLRTDGLDVETTLVIISSKSFTTMETALNLALVKEWFLSSMKSLHPEIKSEDVFARHFLASTANPALASKAGFSEDSIFKFWDWVGGRYSVSSACGILPLSIAIGPQFVDSFLSGMNEMDTHFKQETDLRKNIPALLGMIDYFHINVQDYPVKCLIPYSTPLHSFLMHIA